MAASLWSTIPTRADVPGSPDNRRLTQKCAVPLPGSTEAPRGALCHGTDPLLVGEAHSGQAKVADLRQSPLAMHFTELRPRQALSHTGNVVDKISLRDRSHVQI